jgi:hypothetical protein
VVHDPSWQDTGVTTPHCVVAVGPTGPAQATRCPAPCRPALPLILIVIVILMMFIARSNHDHDHSGHSRTNGQQRLRR